MPCGTVSIGRGALCAPAGSRGRLGCEHILYSMLPVCPRTAGDGCPYSICRGCGVSIGSTALDRYCGGRRNASPTGTFGGAAVSSAVRCGVGGAAGGGTPPLQGLSVVWKKTASATGAHIGAPLRIISVVRIGSEVPREAERLPYRGFRWCGVFDGGAAGG